MFIGMEIHRLLGSLWNSDRISMGVVCQEATRICSAGSEFKLRKKQTDNLHYCGE